MGLKKGFWADFGTKILKFLTMSITQQILDTNLKILHTKYKDPKGFHYDLQK